MGEILAAERIRLEFFSQSEVTGVAASICCSCLVIEMSATSPPLRDLYFQRVMHMYVFKVYGIVSFNKVGRALPAASDDIVLRNHEQRQTQQFTFTIQSYLQT